MAFRFASVNEEQILSIKKAAVPSADYSTCAVYPKTIIHLNNGESGGY